MPPKLRKTRAKRDTAGQSSLPATEFKTRCLELMDRVRETGVEYIVTKHGTPVAKLVPYVPAKRPKFFGALKGTVLKYERPFDPIDAEWDIHKA